MSLAPDMLEDAVRAHQGELWGLCYRMTGVAADADELVQETWIRAMERPPADQERSLRPWLIRVAANLARDRLRRRRRLKYPGPWLPVPVDDRPGPEALGMQRQAVGYAWMVAVEVLTPQQRAVLVLRDVLELSVRETAQSLDMSEANVRVTLHRARRALGLAPQPTGDLEQSLAVVAALMGCLVTGDLEAARAHMTGDVVFTSDGGGVVNAAGVPLVGPDRVARFYAGITRGGIDDMRVELRVLGGLPAVLFRRTSPERARDPLAGVTFFELENGRVLRGWSVVAPDKLSAIRLPAIEDGPAD